MERVKKFVDRFRKPREEFIEKTLENMGISKEDPNYEDYKHKITKLVKRRSNENVVSDFCIPYSKLMAGKVRKELKERDDKIKGLEKKLTQEEELIKITKQKTIKDIFSSNIFTINDSKSYKIMKGLENENKNYKMLKKDTGSENGDLKWRLGSLLEIGMVETSYCGEDELFCLSKTGKDIINRRDKDFEMSVELFEDKKYNLALETTGYNPEQAKKLLTWLNGKKGRGHRIKIKRLYEKLKNPKKVSQRFFAEREKGDTHEKHLGIKITNHETAGKLLLLYS